MTTATTTELHDPLSDEEIVSRISAGDSALFEILMRRHNQRIYRAVRAVLGSPDDVEDVMQQAYLNAYQHLTRFAGEARFATWLTRIAVNEALGRRRKRNRFFIEGENDVTIALIESDAPDPEQLAFNSELREVMEREVGSLPDALRVVVMMRDVEGLSTAETADCLSLSEDVVKTRLHRARTVLRDNLCKRAGVTLQSLFSFGQTHCDRLVLEVMAEIRSS